MLAINIKINGATEIVGRGVRGNDKLADLNFLGAWGRPLVYLSVRAI